MESLLHTILQGDIAILQITGQCPTAHTVLIVLKSGGRLKGVLPHTFIGLFIVEVTDAFHIGIG